MTSGDTDADARAEAIDPNRSILLQAPAGSGKTTILIQRVLRLLSEVDAPEEILAITFTRKAAAEMRRGVLSSLARAADPASNEMSLRTDQQRTLQLASAALQRSRTRHWELEQFPARLRIRTIDSFNQWLTAQLPLAARVGGAARVSAQPQRLYEIAARRTALALDRDSDLTATAQVIFTRLDNDFAYLEQLIAELLAKRTQWLRHLLGTPGAELAAIASAGFALVARRTLQRAVGILPPALLLEGASLAAYSAQRTLQMDNQCAKGLEAWLQPCDELRADVGQLPQWHGLTALALTGTQETLRKVLNKTHGFSAKSAKRAVGGPTENDLLMTERARQWLEDLRDVPGAAASLSAVAKLPPPQFDAADSAALQALSVTLQRAASELQLLFAERGEVDYPYVAAAALSALRDCSGPSDLALRLDSRIRHILVDEFQDTSLDQFELLQQLTADWQSGDGRSLFLVGDPMQSIYQFRNSDVGLFLQARAAGIGELRLDALALTRNFRSDPRIVEFVNRCFTEIFPARDDIAAGQVKYLPAAPTLLADDAAEPVHCYTLAASDPDASATQVASIVASIRRTDSEARIAVLVSARGHATPIVRTLTSAGQSVRGMDLTRLRELSPVQDLLALMRALLQPADRLAWLAVLRAPWCGLTLGELTQLMDGAAKHATVVECASDPGRLANLDSASQMRLRRVIDALSASATLVARRSFSERIELAWLTIGGPATCRSHADRDAIRATLDALASVDRDIERGGLRALLDWADQLGSAPADLRLGAVDVMTIHAAKGLEFDHVILPSLEKQGRKDSPALFDWQVIPGAAPGSGLLLAPLTARDDPRVDVRRSWLREQAKARRQAERVRLMYVAMTRARRSLHLIAAPPRQAAGEMQPVADSPLGSLWPALHAKFVAAAAADIPADNIPRRENLLEVVAPGLPPLRRLPAAWLRPAESPDLRVQGINVATYSASTAPEFLWVGETARHIGSVVHAIFDSWLQEKSLPAVATLASQRGMWHRALQKIGVSAHELATAVDRVEQALTRTLNDPRGRWVLDPKHVESRSEWALTGLVAGRLTQAIVDRCFRDSDGTRWIIDYKTGSHEGGDLEAFLANERERYAPQLQRYRILLPRASGELVRTALYFPLLSRFEELQLDP